MTIEALLSLTSPSQNKTNHTIIPMEVSVDHKPEKKEENFSITYKGTKKYCGPEITVETTTNMKCPDK